MKAIGSFEAKTHLSALLDRAAKGERILITKHGAPVAMLVPPDASAKPGREEALRQIEAFGKGRSLKRLSIRELIQEGRRY
jgi:prevent-host-death family protein